jgi:NTE family protein
MNWAKLDFQAGVASNFQEYVVRPLTELASHTIDIPSVIGGLFGFGNVGKKVANRYRKYLFGAATLQDIPDHPRFVFNSTNVQSGVLCRFSKPYMWDYRVGKIENPKIELAVAVAASSAFPPFLSPYRLDLDPGTFVPNSGTDLERDEFRRQMVLTDGGVYDNLGLETAWKSYKTILVSDAGGGFDAEPRPKRDWFRHTGRMLFTIDNQVRSLRRRQVVGSFAAEPPTRTGAFWSVASDFEDGFGIESPLKCPFERTFALAKVPTRLKKLDLETQKRLINWGYAACDFPIRKFLRPDAAAPQGFPYDEIGV